MMVYYRQSRVLEVEGLAFGALRGAFFWSDVRHFMAAIFSRIHRYGLILSDGILNA